MSLTRDSTLANPEQLVAKVSRRGKPRLYENIWAVGIFMGTNIKPQASYKGFIYRVISVYIKSAYGHIYGLYWLFI